MRNVPLAVRFHLYLFWAGMVIAGIGVVGFVLSFWQVGSWAAAAVDVHEDIPVLAYASITAWVAGLAAMWWGRRHLNAAVAAKLAEDRAGLFIEVADEPGGDDVLTGAPDGREP